MPSVFFRWKKLGFEDTRGTLFHEFARCVKEVNPKIFMAENVRGLVSHDKGRTLTTIINVLEALGYHTQQKFSMLHISEWDRKESASL